MKKTIPAMALLAAVIAALVLCVPCAAEDAFIDYASSVRPDAGSATVRQLVTVNNYVDGDTTHFIVPASVDPSGEFRARYIAVNTPESTGKIEEWGKAASRFTKEKLENAEEILIESDSDQWNPDSTSSRYLVWVWYRPVDDQDYRNLNIELLQNGLAIANSAAQNRYGDVCMAAIAQAKAHKLNIYSGEKDPDFFYGDAIELTIRELRLHPEAYDGKKVTFTGIVTQNHKKAVFIEDYDVETGLYFGISAYYGNNMSGGGLDILTPGNEVRIVGIMQYYEAGHAWQISGMNYRAMKPNDPGNIQKLSDGHTPSWKETTVDLFHSTVTLETDEGSQAYPYAYLALGTTVSVNGLPVADVYIPEQNNGHDGTFKLDCGFDQKIKIVVPPVKDEAGRLLTHEDFSGKTIDARGVVAYNPDAPEYCQYYIRVYTLDGLTIHDN